MFDLCRVVFAGTRGTAEPAVCICAVDSAGSVEPGRAGAASGAVVGGGGSGHADDGAADPFQWHGPRVRGIVEISAGGRHGDCAVAAGLILPGLRILERRRAGGLDLCGAGGAGRRAHASLAGCGVGVAADWLRNQNGPRAHAYVEAGCVRRSARDCGRIACRRNNHHGVCGGVAREASCGCRR